MVHFSSLELDTIVIQLVVNRYVAIMSVFVYKKSHISPKKYINKNFFDLHFVSELRDVVWERMLEMMTPLAPDPDCFAMRTVSVSAKKFWYYRDTFLIETSTSILFSSKNSSIFMTEKSSSSNSWRLRCLSQSFGPSIEKYSKGEYLTFTFT